MMNRMLLLSAALTGAVVNATTYATFYSDADCTKDATVDFSVNNAGCFSAGGNQYVKYHGTNVQCWSLVKSPDASCPCQFDCVAGLSTEGTKGPDCAGLMIPDGKCLYIGQSESLRFIGGKCPSNDCPDRSSRSIPTLEDYQEDYEDDAEYEEEPEAEAEAEPETVDKRSDVPEQTPQEAAAELTTDSDDLISPVLDRRDTGPPGIGYFRFCKDKYCTLDCTINFRTTNPGCINGGDFKSMQLAGGIGSTSNLRLVGTPHDSCSCQDSCWNVVGPECMELPDNLKSKGSYRMLQQDSCDSNNC